MATLPETIKTLADTGVLLAVLVSLAALFYTVRADRKLRRLEFLYRKNDRLIDFHAKLEQFKREIDAANAKAGEFLHSFKESGLTPEENAEQLLEVQKDVFATILEEVKKCYLLTQRYRYIFSESDMALATKYFKDVDSVDRTDPKAFERVICRVLKLDAHIRERVEAELSKLADELRRVGA